jgi:hypothetical protein
MVAEGRKGVRSGRTGVMGEEAARHLTQALSLFSLVLVPKSPTILWNPKTWSSSDRIACGRPAGSGSGARPRVVPTPRARVLVPGPSEQRCA